MSTEFISSLIYNISLLLALSIIYTLVPTDALRFKGVKRIYAGLMLAIIGIGIMYNPFELSSGIIFDSRSVLLSMSGMFMGFVPTLIAVIVTGLFRISIGGIGTLAGITQIILTASVGLIWRYWRFEKMTKDKSIRWYELYILGVVVHLVMLGTIAIMPWNSAVKAYEVIALPLMIIFPFGTLILGLVLFAQIDNKNTYLKLEESKERLNVTLLSVGDGVITTDKDGNITLINKIAEEITGWKYDEIVGKNVREAFVLVHEITKKKLKDPVQKVLDTGQTIGLAKNTEVICKNGLHKPIADSAAPIRNHDGDIIGVVLVIRDITEERNKQIEINHLAFHDNLTGLYNRSFFEKEIERLDVERSLPLSIILGDVNGLKLINDAFGHYMGDILLQKIAVAIKKACREEDIVTRWGGDEFIILLPNTDEEDVSLIGKRITKYCSKVEIPYVKCSISLGHETKTKITQDTKHIIKNAEASMYRMKLDDVSGRDTTITTILNTFLERNPREHSHSNNVSKLCKSVGKAMNLSNKEINELGFLGMMHDVGKIAIDENILNKSAILTDDDWEDMRRHPEIGYRILSASNKMAYIAEYVLKHHEKIDGSGYPNGIKGDEIPIQSKILSIVDAYDEISSDRPYENAKSKDSAIENLLAKSGTHYDSDIIKIFVEKVLNK